MSRFGIAATVALTWSVSPSAALAQLYPPPLEVQAEGAVGKTRHYVGTGNGGEDTYLRATMTVHTAKEYIRLAWEGKVSAAAPENNRLQNEHVSFAPTACCYSMLDPKIWYVAGVDADGPVLQKWVMDSDPALISETTPSGPQTGIEIPSITRTVLPVDPTLRTACDMVASKYPPAGTGATEEVLIFEWENRDLYAINPTSGTKTVRVPFAQVGNYRSVQLKVHSIYGAVLDFRRRPFFGEYTGWQAFVNNNPGVDPDVFVAYDSDLDGALDGTFLISFTDFDTHPVFNSGSWLDS